MDKKYLIDTCVWRDFYEDRVSKSERHLGKYATEFFLKVITKKDKIIFSESLIWELKKYCEEKEVIDMLNLLFLNKTLIRIDITKEEHVEAKKLSQQRKIPIMDCLNAVQARNHKATLITQDKHILENLSDIISSKRPEQIS